MMSLGEREMFTSYADHQRGKPSKLQVLQANFQKKLLKERERKLLEHMEKDKQRPQATISRYQDKEIYRNDAFSAPGGVRNFFQERKKELNKCSSATQIGFPSKKREGYDKSHPLQPINREPKRQSKTTTPVRRHVDARYHNEFLTEFQKWQIEQDNLDRQRMKRNEMGNGELKVKMDVYQRELDSSHSKIDQEHEFKNQAYQRREEGREWKTGNKQREQDKKSKQAEMGRRRREESERRQKEMAERLRHQNEAEQQRIQREEDKQAEMIQKLEEELRRKQQDLREIQMRRMTSVSPDEHELPVVNQHSQPEVIPTKPKKVLRRDHSKNLEKAVEHVNSQPAPAVPSPTKTRTKPKQHEMNVTYRITQETSQTPPVRKSSPPVPAEFSQQTQYPLADGEQNDVVMDLVPCLNCGRSFASDRLSKHQKACTKASKPRKKFNTTAQRVAGSGAEEFINKKSKNKNTTKPAKSNKKDWRTQHKEFIEAIRYAKMATAMESKGSNLANLPPPPKSENLDYIQCPHCQRRFNEAAADRHIPKCKDIKAKPSMLKKGGGTRR